MCPKFKFGENSFGGLNGYLFLLTPKMGTKGFWPRSNVALEIELQFEQSLLLSQSRSSGFYLNFH
jgi:hypothetical protein